MAREKGVARKAGGGTRPCVGGGTRPPDVGTEDGDGTGYTQRIEAAHKHKYTPPSTAPTVRAFKHVQPRLKYPRWLQL